MCLSALENFSGIKTQRDEFESCPEISDAAEEVFEARGGGDPPDAINVDEVLGIVERAGKLSSDDVRCYRSKLAPGGQKEDVICTEVTTEDDSSYTGLGREADVGVAAATGGILALVIKGFIATGRRK